MHISSPLNVNRSLIESSSSIGFEPVTYETEAAPLPSLLKALGSGGGNQADQNWHLAKTPGTILIWRVERDGGGSVQAARMTVFPRNESLWQRITRLRYSQDPWVNISA